MLYNKRNKNKEIENMNESLSERESANPERKKKKNTFRPSTYK